MLAFPILFNECLLLITSENGPYITLSIIKSLPTHNQLSNLIKNSKSLNHGSRHNFKTLKLNEAREKAYIYV